MQKTGTAVLCRRLDAPTLQLVLAPGNQIVHVRKQLFPCHDSWSRIWLHEIRALRTLGISSNLLAHGLTDASKLVLELHAVLQLLCNASLFGDSALLCNCRQHVMFAHLQSRSFLAPRLQLVLAPSNQ